MYALLLFDKKTNIKFIEAVTQADNVICYNVNINLCDGAVSPDGDFIINSSRKMMLIKEFKYNRTLKKKIKHISNTNCIITLCGIV